MPDEIEAKYRLGGPEEQARLRERLVALGARPEGTAVEQDVLFDRPDGSLEAAGCVLRLRVRGSGPAGWLTYKGPPARAGVLKRRAELEVAVADAAALRAILEALGYVAVLEYAKQREIWQLGAVAVTLDTLACGWFCEVEGSPEAVMQLATALGLAPDAAEPASYPELMARYRGATRE
ncbi:MAG TPA: class IV adenylate cyclase [Chloroflexota bacterium]|nr:class IV adenylate cyclase [Chloroflexota bacterium]